MESTLSCDFYILTLETLVFSQISCMGKNIVVNVIWQ